jgi:glutathione S-transferase
MKTTENLLVRDWKQDVINLVIFPRARCIVNMSPFAVKLETWLRFNKLPYRAVSNDFTKMSSRGQLPFIELNGRQFGDSNIIMENLIGTFHLSIDQNLTTRERAEARLLTVLIEESIFRIIAYQRSIDCSWIATDNGVLGHLTGIKKFIFQKLVIKKLQKSYKHTVHVQGIGRKPPQEVDEIAKQDLLILSFYLGDKPYFFGTKPTTVDATAFGQLVTLTDTPLTSSAIKPYMEQTTPNLIKFVNRIKQNFWPDWDILCSTLAINAPDHQ